MTQGVLIPVKVLSLNPLPFIRAEITSIKIICDLDQLRYANTAPPKDIEIIVGHAPMELIKQHPKNAKNLAGQAGHAEP